MTLSDILIISTDAAKLQRRNEQLEREVSNLKRKTNQAGKGGGRGRGGRGTPHWPPSPHPPQGYPQAPHHPAPTTPYQSAGAGGAGQYARTRGGNPSNPAQCPDWAKGSCNREYCNRRHS